MTTYRSHVNEDGSISCTVDGMPVEDYVVETAKKLVDGAADGHSLERAEHSSQPDRDPQRVGVRLGRQSHPR